MMVANACKVKQRHFVDEPPPIVREYTSIAEIDTKVVAPAVVFDTIFQVLPNDTIVIHDSVTKIKLKVVKLPGDSIYISPECPPDTITVTKYRVEKLQESIVERVNKSGFKEVIITGIVAVLALFAIGYTINAIKK
jgi:hypothetical protein